MPYSVVQSGSTLKFLDTTGALSNLTLPTNATLLANLAPRWVVSSGFALLVNTPSFPLTIDGSGTVRPLTPKPPSIAPVVSATGSGALTGTYAGIRYTYLIKDAIGNVLAESDYSPASNSASLTAQVLAVTGVSVSPETTVTARRLYRPTAGGAVLFPWFDIEGNTVTTGQDDLADASLSLIAAPTLGTPPRLTLMKEWRNLLWGVGDVDRDSLFYTEAGFPYAWPADNLITVPGSGRDLFGIRSLMPRRESLGIGRRDIIWQLTGTSPNDFTLVKLSENTGVESNESMVVYRDTVFWLWKDGVYQWDDAGIVNISDPHVSSWFNTDSYFNRSLFENAFAAFDPVRLKYRLFLASAGSAVIDRWVEYDLSTKTWWGPHRTNAFSPSCAFILADATDKTQAVTGSFDGHVWVDQAIPTDGANTGIPVSLDTRFYDAGLPDVEKFFGELSLVGKVQPAGTLTITPTVGYLNSPTSTPFTFDMTKGRQRLGRIGQGKTFQLNFTHTTPGESVELYQFTLPISLVGRR